MLVLLTKVNTHQSGKVNSGQWDLWSDKSKGEKKSEGDIFMIMVLLCIICLLSYNTILTYVIKNRRKVKKKKNPSQAYRGPQMAGLFYG